MVPALEQAKSEHKQTEEELRRNELRFRELIEHSSDWIWEVNTECIYTYSNPIVEKILGYKQEEVIGTTPFKMMPPVKKEQTAEIFKNAVKKNEPIVALENLCLHKNGRSVVLETSGVPFFNEKGKIVGYRGVDRDITERKQFEAARRKVYNDTEMKVKKLTVNLSNANRELKALLDRREIEKKATEQTMLNNLKRLVFPYLDILEQQKNDTVSSTYAKIIRTNIKQLIAPISKNLSGVYLDLTPTEIKVADLIQQGKSSKSIAAVLNISLSTVEKHRNKIRKKLGILKKKINLYTYLKSLA